MSVHRKRELDTTEIPGSLTIYTTYINSQEFKNLEVNETHFQVSEMGGYTRHIQDNYFEHDFYTYKREDEPSDLILFIYGSDW